MPHITDIAGSAHRLRDDNDERIKLLREQRDRRDAMRKARKSPAVGTPIPPTTPPEPEEKKTCVWDDFKALLAAMWSGHR